VTIQVVLPEMKIRSPPGYFHHVLALLLKAFWRRFWFKPHIRSRDSSVAFDS